MGRHIQDAVVGNYPPCPRCKSLQGDPCRTPGWKTCAPHQERLALIQAANNRKAAEEVQTAIQAANDRKALEEINHARRKKRVP